MTPAGQGKECKLTTQSIKKIQNSQNNLKPRPNENNQIIKLHPNINISRLSFKLFYYL